MRRLLLQGLLGLMLAWLGAWAFAHVRLVHINNGKPLRWASPSSVSIVVNDVGSDDVLDESAEVAIRMAIDEWNAVQGTGINLVENTDPIQQARTDWEANGIHLVQFDENNESGWFPDGSGTVAVTPIQFDSNGRIVDADILFNGKGYRFTTAGEALRFDIQDVATHELGHFLGLDHSGCAGSSMHPYVDPTNILHRSLSADDTIGLRQIYPATTYSTLSGVVRRSTGSTVVAGAYVVATDAAGRASGGTLSATNGAFTIDGLGPGTYTVAALPLDEPVSASNVTAWYTVQTDFEPATYPGSVVLGSGEDLALGTLFVGDDVSVNLGKISDRYPLRAVIGTATQLTVRGTSLFAGGTLSCSDPDVVVTPISWLGSQVTFQVSIPPGEALGLIDLDFVDSIGRRAFLPGAIELTPPDPSVGSVSPTMGSNLGGTTVYISGSGFSDGARVVLGDRWYSAANGLVVQNANTIELVTEPTALGTHDVVVIDSSGVEGRLADGYQSAYVPKLQTLVPAAGSASGGTQVQVSGSNFQAGLVVRIAGVVQSSVTINSSTSLTVVTTGGITGTTLLEVQNPGGATDQSPFEYVATADPSVASVSVSAGPAAGGTEVVFSGSNLDNVTEIVFGANLGSGGSGVAGTNLEIVDPNTVRVRTPPGAPGRVDVLLRDAGSGQGELLLDAFTYQGASGGGGCGVAPFDPTRLRPSPWSGAWFLVLAVGAWWRAKRARALRPLVGTPV